MKALIPSTAMPVWQAAMFVTLGDYGNCRFILHKDIRIPVTKIIQQWVVSEYLTGRRIASGKTKHAAIDQAIYTLQQYGGDLATRIQSFKHFNGLK